MLRDPNVRTIVYVSLFLGAALQLAHIVWELVAERKLDISILGSLKWISIGSAGVLLLVFLDHWIAKKNLMRFIPGVPCFGGRWEGYKSSEIFDGGKKKPICVEIRQGLFITVRDFADSRGGAHKLSSRSIAAGQYEQRSDHFDFIFTSRTERIGENSMDESHYVTFILVMDAQDRDRMQGLYYTDRVRFPPASGAGTRGHAGRLELVRSKKECVGRLVYDEEKGFDEAVWACRKARNSTG